MEIVTRWTRDTTKDHAKIGEPREVSLDGRERACLDRYEANIKQGMSRQEAAIQALASMMPSARTKEFVLWMSDRTVTLTQDKRVRMVGAPIIKKPIIAGGPMKPDETKAAS